MFENAGETIQSIAKGLTIFNFIVAGLSFGCLLLWSILSKIFVIALIAACSCLAYAFTTWFFGLLIYGFGELVKNSDILTSRAINEQK